MNELARKTVELSFDNMNDRFWFVGPDIDADNKSVLEKKLDSPSNVILSPTKDCVPSSRLFAEARPLNTNSTLYPEFSLLPASALALLLILSRRSQYKGDQVQRIYDIIQGTAPAVVDFLFEHIVASSVTNASISRDSGFVTALALPVASNTRQRSSSWVLKELVFASGSSSKGSARALVEPDIPVHRAAFDVTAVEVVHDTTTTSLTHDAIVSAVKKYRRDKLSCWVYLAFGFHATPVVDGCLLGPDVLIPVQITVTEDKKLKHAVTWVQGLRDELEKKKLSPLLTVRDFCILRPCWDDSIFRLHQKMKVTAYDTIPDCPYVVMDYDITGVTKDANTCVRALVDAFTNTIERVMRGDSPTALPAVGYPNFCKVAQTGAFGWVAHGVW